MNEPIRIDRRRFLRRAALLGAALAGAGLAQACQPPASPPSDREISSPPASTPAPTTAGRAAGPEPSRHPIEHLVLVVVDGMMPEYLTLGSFPHLRRLIAGGTSFERAWVGQVVNNTPTSHTTLVSGRLPRTTGVVYFYWRDPRNGRIVKVESEPMIEGDRFATLMRERDLPSIGRAIKQQRPGAKVAAVGSSKDFAAIALGLDVADHIGYAVRLPSDQDGEGKKDQRNVDPRGDVLPDAGPDSEPAQGTSKGPAGDVAPPSRRIVPGSPSSAPLPEALLKDPRYAMTTRQLGDNDVFAGNLAVGLFEAVRPAVLLVNLPDTDQVGHLTGGHTTNPAAVARTMAAADAQIGRLIEAYERAGLFDRTLWVVTSDHGMTPNTVNINPKIVERTLKGSGFAILDGDTSHYWLKDPATAPAAAAAIDAQRAPGLLGTYFKVDHGNGRFAYEPTPAAAAALDSDRRAALEWLLETFAGPESPDLTFALGENVHFHTAPPNTIGAHSEPTWLLQRIPLVFSGPGVRAGHVSPYPARLVDVAPTILTLLALPPDRMDGVVLQDVLAAAAPEAHQAQLNAPATARMKRYQDVLAQLPTGF